MEFVSNQMVFSVVLGFQVPGFWQAGGSEEIGSPGHCEDMAAPNLEVVQYGSLFLQ